MTQNPKLTLATGEDMYLSLSITRFIVEVPINNRAGLPNPGLTVSCCLWPTIVGGRSRKNVLISLRAAEKKANEL